MNEEMYQQVFDEISPFLPENWSRLLYRCFYTTGSWSMKFYVDRGTGEYVDCFKLAPSARTKILQLFQHLDQIIASFRNREPDNKKWTAMTLSVTETGDFHADFGYTDLSESTVNYTMEWEAKYLH